MPARTDGAAPVASAPRTVLVTGAGGAGRTTVAAATAVAAAARQGARTLLLSPEPRHVLEPLLGTGTVPDGLTVTSVDSGEEFRKRAVALQEQARQALDMLGADPLEEDELTELPGSEAYALLRAVREAHGSGEWDTVVVDLPPTVRALSLLALPEQGRRYLRRLLPPERQAARALRPMLAQLAGVPMPAQWLYATAAHWEDELLGVQEAVESIRTEVRFVAEPGPQAVRQLAEARAGLALYGLRLTAVVANRLLPTGSPDPWLAALSAQQQTALKELRDGCAADGTPVYELPHLGREPLGAEDLAALAAPAAVPAPRSAPDDRTASEARAARHTQGVPGRQPVIGQVVDRLAEDGLLVWRLPLPGARKDALSLVRRGDELLVTTGPFRRALSLPSALRRCHVTGAALEESELRVRFTPDPALWPSSGTPPFG